MTDTGPWYFNLVSKQVVAEGSDKLHNLLGPYATRAEAEQALTKVAERNEDWDNDPDWNDESPDERTGQE